MKKLVHCSAALLGLSVFGPVVAQSQTESPAEEIVVKAHPLFKHGSAQSITVLSGEELAEKTQASLGETVSKEAGIRSASFGAAVGRPVIHGLGAARVKTTEDRIDSLDVSVTSTDHAVTVEPFIANQITILKGASSLLYGSGAIGGVVDVQTGRIPTELTGDEFSGRAEIRATDNGNGETAAFRLDGETKGGFAWHVDAFSKEADDYDIPGFVESRQQRAAEAAEIAEALANGETVEEEEEARGELEGSFLDVQGGSVGLSYIFDRGFVGLSVSRTEGEYGLVGGHEEEEDPAAGAVVVEEEEEGVGFIDLEQTRVDFESELRFDSSLVKKVNVRFGINNYEHDEVEGNGEVGTVFENDAWEGRIEVTHAPVLGFDGAFGLQLNDREFSADGEEAFVEPVDSDSQAIFWVGERHSEVFDIETGLRFEQVDYEPTGSNENDVAFEDVDFTTFSASIGGLYQGSDVWKFSALLDYSQRAPTIEELFSNGPHLATQTFEIGDPTLDEESALGLTFTGVYDVSGVKLSATIYYTDFEDFIYQEDTGATREGLRELIWAQDDARFVGIDLTADIALAKVGQGDLGLSLLFDAVDAELDVSGNDNLPRIPATRYGIGLDWASDLWDVSFDYVRVNSQSDTAINELGSDAYDDLGFRVSRSIALGEGNVSLFLAGRNLTDDDQRNHVSFVKDFAPAPGRTFEIGARYSF